MRYSNNAKSIRKVLTIYFPIKMFKPNKKKKKKFKIFRNVGVKRGHNVRLGRSCQLRAEG